AHRRAPAPVRRPREAGGVAPAPAPNHAVGDPRRARRINGWRLRIVIRIYVPAPLPDIPMHVEQPPAVWQLAPSGSGATGLDHCIFSQHLFIAAARKFGRRPGATGVFPLRLRRQAVAGCISNHPPDVGFQFGITELDFLLLPAPLIARRPSLLAAQPVAEEHRVVPGDLLNRMVRRRADLCGDAWPFLW